MKKNTWALVMNGLLIAGIIALSCLYYRNHLDLGDKEWSFRVGAYLLGSIILSIFLLFENMEPNIDASNRLLGIILIAGIADLVSCVFTEIMPDNTTGTNIILSAIYFVSPTMCICYWFYIKIICVGEKYKKRKLDYIITIFGAVDYIFTLVAACLGKLFYFGSDYTYHRGELDAFAYIYPTMVILSCIYAEFTYKIPVKKRIICLIFTACPIAAALLSFTTENTIFNHLTYIIAPIIIYGGIQVESNREKIEQNRELEKTRINAALLQIKPHFIQNCLTNIRGLMHIDQNMAEDMLINLSGYLRNTFTFLNDDGMIKIEKEMELVDFYTAIEQARFPGKIEVEKNIETPDFVIPSLIIEPLVENAINHGLREKDEKGKIIIDVKDKDDHVEITVTDDGVGFDTSASPSDGKVHVGMKNVEKRIMLMVQGTFDIQSEIGKGTKVTVTIPKGLGYAGINN